MLPSTLLVVDSNFLRDIQLREFLEASPDHAIAIDPLVLVEVFKKNPELTGRESFLIAADFISQIYVIKPAHQWLRNVVSNESEVERLIDLNGTQNLRLYCEELRNGRFSDESLSQLRVWEMESKDYMQRLSNQLFEYEDTLKEETKEFTKEQLHEIRSGKDISDATKEKINNLLFKVTAQFVLNYQEPNRTAPLAVATARNMFSFRYALCIVLFYLLWVKDGRAPKKLNKRLNDIIDIQIATISTFFNGVASRDQHMFSIARQASIILSRWDAFIPVQRGR